MNVLEFIKKIILSKYKNSENSTLKSESKKQNNSNYTKLTRDEKKLIIRSIISTGEKLGSINLLDLLEGNSSTELSDRSLENSPYWNCIKNVNTSELRLGINNMVRDGLLVVGDKNIKSLVVTLMGTIYLEGKENEKPLPQNIRNVNDYTSIKHKGPSYLTQIQLKNKQVNEGKTNAYSVWSKDEEERVMMRYKSGESIRSIARIHKRSPGAIRKRIDLLNIGHEYE